MTYFGFLAIFLLIPLATVSWLLWQDLSQGRQLPVSLRSWSARAIIMAHVLIAVIYTTPWDNYLVATAVWWYDPDLVTGVVIGWVPIEEYTFFILQTLLTGIWFVWLARRVRVSRPFQPNLAINIWAGALTFVVWLISTIFLFSGLDSATYLTLILSWALLPVIGQLAFGADILWHYRPLVFWAITVPTLFLAAADSLAINAGTWTISPQQSTGILLGGILPIEEALFFLITNVLVVFGITLMLAQASHERVGRLRQRTRLMSNR